MELLKGKKTYLATIAGILVFLAWVLGYIAEDVMLRLMGVLGFAGLAGLRKSVKNTHDELIKK